MLSTTKEVYSEPFVVGDADCPWSSLYCHHGRPGTPSCTATTDGREPPAVLPDTSCAMIICVCACSTRRWCMNANGLGPSRVFVVLGSSASTRSYTFQCEMLNVGSVYVLVVTGGPPLPPPRITSTVSSPTYIAPDHVVHDGLQLGSVTKMGFQYCKAGAHECRTGSWAKRRTRYRRMTIGQFFNRRTGLYAKRYWAKRNNNEITFATMLAYYIHLYLIEVSNEVYCPRVN